MAFPMHQTAFQENHIKFDVADCLLLLQALDILQKKPLNAYVSNPSPTSIKEKS